MAGSRASVSQITETISKLNSVILVGFKDSKIVACVHVEKDRSNSHIRMLAVNLALQGAGAGKQILSQAEGTPLKFSVQRNSSWLLCPQEVNSFPSICGGYRQTGSIMDYPLSQGIPNPALKIEVLEKRSDMRFDSKPDVGNYANA